MTKELTSIKGVSAKRAALLSALGITTVEALLAHMPREYKDFSRLTPVSALEAGQEAACAVRIAGEARLSFVRKGLSIVSVPAQDETGAITLVWYNQPYRKNAVAPGKCYVALGPVEESRSGKQMTCPALEAVGGDGPRIPGILPVYPLTSGLSQPVLRAVMRSALDATLPVKDALPAVFRTRHALCERNFALENIHFPVDMLSAEQAKRRICTEELLYFLIALQLLGKARKKDHGRALPINDDLTKNFLQKLSFAPTAAQTRAFAEIAADLGSSVPMSRLLQGDVGSGKTVVALFALYAAMQNGVQGVMMAPTEILARQHALTAAKVLGEENVCFLSGSLNARQRKNALAAIACGDAKAIIGTHALVQQGVSYADLGLVITDEQHRFGVRQRALLSAKGMHPHALIMSATPIPRTLALLLFGDLDVSTLDERPPGRQPVGTHVVGAHKREAMYGFMREQVEAGRQAYVVCPVIETDDAADMASVNDIFAELSGQWLRGLRLQQLHGKLPAKDKEQIMRAFAAGDIDVLVTTTVIEVGVDVPNASIMVIEGADRFGLAQLHQLRGRVGRGGEKSFCFLCYDGGSVQTRERLRLLTQTDDGFAIAQKDLQWRGPGALLGMRQHGMADQVLRYVDDIEVLTTVQNAVAQAMSDPQSEESHALIAMARARYAHLWDSWAD